MEKEYAVNSTIRGKELSIFLPVNYKLQATVMTGPARHVHWCNSGTNIMVVNKQFLVGFLGPTPQGEVHAWHPYQAACG